MDWTNLSSLLWLLAIGGLFYWMMMKGGCGGHGGHAHGGGGHQHGGGGAPEGAAGTGDDAPGGTARDPVCGMQVDPYRAIGMRTVAGRTFYFCSADCVEKFDREPEGYARGAGETEPMPPGAPTRHRGHAGR